MRNCLTFLRKKQVFKKLAIMIFVFMLTSCAVINNKSYITTRGGSYDKSKEFIDYQTIENENSFKVAMLLPLSGKSSVYGIGLKNAALMALEDANNQKLVLKFYDTNSSPDGAVDAINKAIDETEIVEY